MALDTGAGGWAAVRMRAKDREVTEGVHTLIGGHKYHREQIEFLNNARQIKLNELHAPWP